LEWGEFLHLPGQKFYDFSEIRAEIDRETDRLSGKNKGVSNKPINLRIYSPYVLNLTLVDLPGITKVPTGDQPADVEQQILNMCMEFISNPNAIILAVSAANQDLVNSEGLKLARAVDPEGLRTIGVLTKVDIMDQGTDCSDILSNQVIPLRRGYIAVINRSQKDIQENLPIRTGLVKEAKFFATHPKYRSMLSKCGTTNMARTLNQLLMHHIRDCLPEIKSRINHRLQEASMKLASLGECIDDQSSTAKGAALLKMLAQFSSNFNNQVDGKGSSEVRSEITELYGGARISYIFNEVFGRRLRSLDPFEGLSDEDIRTAIANANGTRPSLFVPEISFDLLVRKQIARLDQPGLDCLDKVRDEMLKMVAQCETPELSRFPYLRDRTFDIVNHLVRTCMAPAQAMISNLIQIELAYINTSHPDFVGGKAAVSAAQQSRKLQSQTAHQQQQQQGPGGAPGSGSGSASAASAARHVAEHYENSMGPGAGAGGGAGGRPHDARGAGAAAAANNSSSSAAGAGAGGAPTSSTATQQPFVNTGVSSIGGADGSGGSSAGGFFGFFQSPSGKNGALQNGHHGTSGSSSAMTTSSSGNANRGFGSVSDYNSQSSSYSNTIKLPEVTETVFETVFPNSFYS
jgi:dynamin 1-like protein